MPASTTSSIASGALFGAALTAAGVYSPDVIMGQMQLTDFHMLKSFIMASSFSAIAIMLYRAVATSPPQPRIPSPLGYFAYDGNLVGGSLLGFGMALTGACPGTVLPQVATGVRSGPFVLLGGLIGGTLYSKWGENLTAKPTPAYNIAVLNNHRRGAGSARDSRRIVASDATANTTVSQIFRATESEGIIAYSVLCLSIIIALEIGFPGQKSSALVSPILGGVFIGLSQAASLLLTTYTLGVSTAYEQLGDLFWWTLTSLKTPRPNTRGTNFAIGTLLGSFVLARIAGISSSSSTFDIGAVKAVLGGVFLTFGARIAGGCTSGHGISGMSMLSIASIVSVTGMFGGGIALSKLLGELGV